MPKLDANMIRKIKRAVEIGTETQEEIAKRLGIGQTSVSKYLRNLTLPANIFARQYQTEEEVALNDTLRGKRNRAKRKERVETLKQLSENLVLKGKKNSHERFSA